MSGLLAVPRLIPAIDHQYRGSSPFRGLFIGFMVFRPFDLSHVPVPNLVPNSIAAGRQPLGLPGLYQRPTRKRADGTAKCSTSLSLRITCQCPRVELNDVLKYNSTDFTALTSARMAIKENIKEKDNGQQQ